MYVYLDNAATSRFKPAGVFKAINDDLKRSANSGRSGHRDALAAEMKIEDCRRYLLSAFGAEEGYDLIFTKSCTEALNLALFGYIKGGERALTTANEHNAVLRPLFELERRGQISLDVLEQERDGAISVQKLKERSRGADIVVVGGACNVTGTAIDVAEVAKAVKDSGGKLLLDGAQCAPLANIDLARDDIDMLACPAHKGLHGVCGLGFLIKKSDIPLRPLVYGGTGTYSSSVYQPSDAPEGYEAGTLFAGGIAALHEGAKWSFDHLSATRKKFDELTKTLLYNLKTIGCTVYSANNAAGIVAFNVKDADSMYVADLLDEEGVAVRAGLHCAPLVHRHFGTTGQGMVRASLGVETTPADILYLSNALLKIMARL